MLLQKIKEEELEFLEGWYNSFCMTECLFSDFDNLGEFDKTKLGHVRLYQRGMVSQEALIDFDTTAKHHKLDEKETFQLRKNVADLYNLGARGYGKSVTTLRLDIPISSIHDKKLKSCFYSIDESRVRGIVDDVKKAFDYHPIFKIYNYNCLLRPKIVFANLSNGWEMKGVLMNLNHKNPGHGFYQMHVNKFWGDEVSMEIDKVANKKKETEHDLGAIYRLAGMTDFPKYSPTGKIFHNKANKKHIVNLPRYVSPYWNEKDKEERKEQYGGIEALNYKIYVDGEPMPDAHAEFQNDRIEECYLKTKKIKRFELKKKQYKDFKKLIIVERPKNANRIFIASDIGDGAGGSDINIFSEVGESYYWLYNIILYSMTEDEQFHILKYIVEELKANVLGFDCGEACGRGLFDRFEKLGFGENLVWYRGNNKVISGFQKDEQGKIKIDRKGIPIPKEEFMREWGVKRLKNLLYNTRLYLPKDYKLDTQLTSVVSIKSGTRVLYECISETGDHLFDSFLVFANSQWLKKDFNATPEIGETGGLGVNSGKTNKSDTLLEDILKQRIIRTLESNKNITCTKQEYKNFVKDYLLNLANKMVFNGNPKEAKKIMTEFKKLENKYNEEI